MKTLLLGALVLSFLAPAGCGDKSIGIGPDHGSTDIAQGPTVGSLGTRAHPDPRAANPTVTIRGSYEATADGCYILTRDDSVQVDLQFTKGEQPPKFPNGTRVEVIGQYAFRLGSRCVGGPILIVDSIRQLPGDKENTGQEDAIE